MSKRPSNPLSQPRCLLSKRRRGRAEIARAITLLQTLSARATISRQASRTLQCQSNRWPQVAAQWLSSQHHSRKYPFLAAKTVWKTWLLTNFPIVFLEGALQAWVHARKTCHSIRRVHSASIQVFTRRRIRSIQASIRSQVCQASQWIYETRWTETLKERNKSDWFAYPTIIKIFSWLKQQTNANSLSLNFSPCMYKFSTVHFNSA